MFDRKTFHERLGKLPLEYQLIFLEDLEGTIDAHLTVFEKASQKETRKTRLCKFGKTPIRLSTYSHKRIGANTENSETFERTERRPKAPLEIRANTDGSLSRLRTR